MLSVGEKIKKMRELRNFTQNYMAEQLKMGQAGYSKIEQGETDISYSRLEQIAKVLKTNVEDIINFDEKKIFNNYFDNVHQYTTNGNIYTDKLVLEELQKFYQKHFEDRLAEKNMHIADLQKEISYLRIMLEKALK